MTGNNTNTSNRGLIETCHHIADRMIGFSLAGGVFGGLTAMYKGRLVLRQASRTSLSCAIVASTCFTAERIFYSILQFDDEFSRLLSSHVLSGASAGGLLGLLYNGKPKMGAFAFAPFMLILGVSETVFAEFQKSKQLEYYQQQESLQRTQQEQER